MVWKGLELTRNIIITCMHRHTTTHIHIHKLSQMYNYILMQQAQSLSQLYSWKHHNIILTIMHDHTHTNKTSSSHKYTYIHTNNYTDTFTHINPQTSKYIQAYILTNMHNHTHLNIYRHTHSKTGGRNPVKLSTHEYPQSSPTNIQIRSQLRDIFSHVHTHTHKQT